MTISTRLLAAAALWCCLLPAGAITIVQTSGVPNGDAEWKQSVFFVFASDGLWAHTAASSAALAFCPAAGCVDEVYHGTSLSQELATRPGDTYELSFFVKANSGASKLSIFWDGALMALADLPNGPLQKYTFSGLVSSADSARLQVHGMNTDGGQLAFEGLSVMRVGDTADLPPVPPAQGIGEPGAALLLLAALGALVAVSRRRSA